VSASNDTLSGPDRRGPGRFSHTQRTGLEVRQADWDRTLTAAHRLESALAEAAPGREQDWRGKVVAAVRDLHQRTIDEAANADSPDSLLSDVARTQPWLRNRVRGLRQQYRQSRDALESLRAELDGAEGTTVDYGDLRQRLGWILTSLRHQRARESDLIYEAYYDAFRADLAADAARPPGGAE